MNPLVFPYGPQPCKWLIVGEAPGREEYLQGKPFVGAAGHEQQSLLYRNSLLQSSFRLANVYPIYKEGNPDPSPGDIDDYADLLHREIHLTNPSLIVAVGRISIRWFLGESAELDEVHGVPHQAGCFDSTRRNRAPAHCTILPVTHPAAMFYDDTGHKREIIDYDYRRVAETIRRIKQGHNIDYPIDGWAGQEYYRDVTGKELEGILKFSAPEDLLHIGLDTEDVPSGGWIQISLSHGTGFVLRSTQSDFQRGISALQYIVNNGSEIITHDADTPRGCLYDTGRCREMGLELRRAKMFNTMYNLMLYRGEPKGLKPAAYRFCGVRLTPYHDLIGDIGKEKQLVYLKSILDISSRLPIPEKRMVYDNDGTCRLYKPEPIHKTVERIIAGVESGKVDKDGNLVDPYEKWYDIGNKERTGNELRSPVEAILGKMPEASLEDLPLPNAIRYAAADADITRRLSFKCKERNQREGLVNTMSRAMLTIPHFEEMQYNGMPASRDRLETLRDRMQGVMDDKLTRLSLGYFNGQPFNPASPPQTAKLLDLRGIKAGKFTKKGNKPSTSKKSIEAYRYKDPAIELLFDWREHSKIRGFTTIFLGEFADHEEIHDVKTVLNIAKTETRRPSSQEPNLLNIPVRTEIGRAVRGCFVVAPGQAMVGGDLSQIELRCLADDSGSQLLIDIFCRDRDPHGEIGVRVFGIPKPPSDSSKEEIDNWEFQVRLPAKTTNFGIVYGQQKYGLYEQFRTYGLDNYSIDDCENLRREILKMLGIDEYIRVSTQDAKRTGMVRDISGMPHYLPNLFNRDDRLRSEAERQVISYKIQSMAQFMIQNSMAHFGPIVWKLQDSDIDVKQRLQVYDELIDSCQEDAVELVGNLMIDSLVNHSGVKLKVPVKAKSHIGVSWDELK